MVKIAPSKWAFSPISFVLKAIHFCYCIEQGVFLCIWGVGVGVGFGPVGLLWPLRGPGGQTSSAPSYGHRAALGLV